MIYFDNAATTKPSETALNKANVYNTEKYFNASALYHGGLSVAEDIKSAKQAVLKALGTIKHEVIFTSCGTESDNTAVFCSVKRGIFVTDKAEHSAIYKSFLSLKERGLNVYFAELNKDGSVSVDDLLNFVKQNKDVSFVSIMHVNNETGAINDINSIAKKIKQINPKIVFHSDGVQAFGKLVYRLSEDVDLYSMSAHKINALKGTGALVKRKGLNLCPYLIGGGQENGLRSGTENVFGIKVFEYALIEHYDKLRENFDKVAQINKYIKDNVDKSQIQVLSGDNSSPYVLSLSAKGLRGETVMHSLETKGVVVGNGSACSSKNRFSRVLTACGYDEQILDGVIRVSFSAESTIEEAKEFTKILNGCVSDLNRIMK